MSLSKLSVLAATGGSALGLNNLKAPRNPPQDATHGATAVVCNFDAHDNTKGVFYLYRKDYYNSSQNKDKPTLTQSVDKGMWSAKYVRDLSGAKYSGNLKELKSGFKSERVTEGKRTKPVSSEDVMQFSTKTGKDSEHDMDAMDCSFEYDFGTDKLTGGCLRAFDISEENLSCTQKIMGKEAVDDDFLRKTLDVSRAQYLNFFNTHHKGKEETRAERVQQFYGENAHLACLNCYSRMVTKGPTKNKVQERVWEDKYKTGSEEITTFWTEFLKHYQWSSEKKERVGNYYTTNGALSTTVESETVLDIYRVAVKYSSMAFATTNAAHTGWSGKGVLQTWQRSSEGEWKIIQDYFAQNDSELTDEDKSAALAAFAAQERGETGFSAVFNNADPKAKASRKTSQLTNMYSNGNFCSFFNYQQAPRLQRLRPKKEPLEQKKYDTYSTQFWSTVLGADKMTSVAVSGEKYDVIRKDMVLASYDSLTFSGEQHTQEGAVLLEVWQQGKGSVDRKTKEQVAGRFNVMIDAAAFNIVTKAAVAAAPVDQADAGAAAAAAEPAAAKPAAAEPAAAGGEPAKDEKKTCCGAMGECMSNTAGFLFCPCKKMIDGCRSCCKKGEPAAAK